LAKKQLTHNTGGPKQITGNNFYQWQNQVVNQETHGKIFYHKLLIRYPPQ